MLLSPREWSSYQASRVLLRRLTANDRREFVELVNASSRFLKPWVKMPASLPEFDEYLERFDGETAECLLICVREPGAIAGAVTISDIIRGPYQRATIGYSAFAPTIGRGYMTEGFPLVFRYAFESMGLHRLEADIQPSNEASLRFAKKIGFRREGYSPGFVFIDNAWRDHERWAISRDMLTSK